MHRLESFAAIEHRAAKRKGGAAKLRVLLTAPLAPAALLKITDDRFLAEFTKKVFQSGFVWRVVRQKWPAFEQLFFNFDIEKILLMPEEMVERKAMDPAIIRNLSKVRTIQSNAQMIKEVSLKHGSFANFVNEWPKDDVIGLWHYLQTHGSRLGGNTGAYALRFLGVDTFLLSRDIESYFRQRELISGGLRSKRSIETIQSAFNQWREESKYSLSEMSQILAYSVGDNSVGI